MKLGIHPPAIALTVRSSKENHPDSQILPNLIVQPNPQAENEAALERLQILAHEKLGFALTPGQMNKLAQDPEKVNYMLGQLENNNFNLRDPDAAMNIKGFALDILGLKMDDDQQLQLSQRIAEVEKDFVLKLTDKDIGFAPETKESLMIEPASTAAASPPAPEPAPIPEPEALAKPEHKSHAEGADELGPSETTFAATVLTAATPTATVAAPASPSPVAQAAVPVATATVRSAPRETAASATDDFLTGAPADLKLVAAPASPFANAPQPTAPARGVDADNDSVHTPFDGILSGPKLGS